MTEKLVELNLILITPVHQIAKFLPKLTPNISIMQISSKFGPFDNVSNHKNTFIIPKYDGTSTKLMTELSRG